MSASSIDAKSELESDTSNSVAAETNSLDNFVAQSGGVAQNNADNDAMLFAFDDAPKDITLNAKAHGTIASAEVVSPATTLAPTPLARETTPPLPPQETVTFPDETSAIETSVNETSSTQSDANIASSNIVLEIGVRCEAAVTTTVYLALGSNLGDRLTNLREAATRLERHPSFEIAAKSRIYETQSVEGGGDAPYLNAVVRATWAGSAMSLLRCVQGVEERMGRPRPPRQGPRIIDVDVLLFGESVIENAHLVVPHPRMMQRAFVLRPLCDVLENGWVREFPLGKL